MPNSNVSRGAARRAAPSKFFLSLALTVASALWGAAPAVAGVMHARSQVGLCVRSQITAHGGVAHAECKVGSKYRVSHEEFGNNYTYGNAGSGHAHHHSGLSFVPAGGAQDDAARPRPEFKPPVPGSRGSSQYIKQTWLPNSSRDKIVVAWDPNSFLQVDPAEVKPHRPFVVRASLVAEGGLEGAVELVARRDAARSPRFETNLTGVFKGAKFELVKHPGGIVSLQFRQPLTWTVAGDPETFDVSLEASVGDDPTRLPPTDPARPADPPVKPHGSGDTVARLPERLKAAMCLR